MLVRTGEAVRRRAGDEYFFRGPAVYVPRVEEEVQRTVQGSAVLPGQALKLRARTKFEQGVQVFLPAPLAPMPLATTAAATYRC